jgi:hypothetical protein
VALVAERQARTAKVVLMEPAAWVARSPPEVLEVRQQVLVLP